ncbi:MAG TPA: hypothetical protein VM580_01075, partial [Labilithrix sp.]|nr:hypothetical protein [Labilithrix sp.]
RRRAAALLERIVDIDRRRVDVFEDLVRLLSDGADWKKVEHVYLRMIERVLDHDDADLRFDLFRKLGLLRRHHLGDAPRACEALGAALRIRPDDASARKEIVELFVLTDQLDNAVAHVRSALDRRPLDPALYGELYDLFLRQHAFDKAWCAVNVLRGLRELTAEQRRFQDDYRPMPLDRVPGQIGEEAWRSHIFHQELDFKLTNVLALLMPALTRVRQAQVLPEQRAGLPFSPSHSWMHQGILAVFANAAEILGVATPELLVGDVRSPLPFAPSSAWLGAIVVAAPAIERQATSLTFLVGKSLAERKLELAARSLVPSLSDLATLLTSAAHICRGETAKDPAAAALGESLSASLSPEEATALQTAILEAAEDSGPFDLKRWARAAELSAMRAGLLVAGDVAPARAAILADGAPTDRSPEERIGELYKFATSDLYADLRGAIGVAVAQ